MSNNATKLILHTLRKGHLTPAKPSKQVPCQRCSTTGFRASRQVVYPPGLVHSFPHSTSPNLVLHCPLTLQKADESQSAARKTIKSLAAGDIFAVAPPTIQAARGSLSCAYKSGSADFTLQVCCKHPQECILRRASTSNPADTAVQVSGAAQKASL